MSSVVHVVGSLPRNCFFWWCINIKIPPINPRRSGVSKVILGASEKEAEMPRLSNNQQLVDKESQ